MSATPTTFTSVPPDLAGLRLCSAYDAAAVWGIDHRTVRRLARQGRIDHRRIGGRVLIPVSEIRRVAQEGLALPASSGTTTTPRTTKPEHTPETAM